MRIVLLCLFSLTLGQTTEKVFIANIDGLRYSEGFGAGSTRMPFVWDSLRPLGTLYTNFYNTGITVTNAGHSTIVSGVRQLLQNNAPGMLLSQVRSREPSLGEYFRKYGGASAADAIVVTGKAPWYYPVSTYPGFGPAWAPTVVRTGENDMETWDSTLAVLARHRPKLCYIVFGQVDKAGHSADTSLYLGAIRQADSLVWQLWKRLQSDSLYRDRTTLIITTDHGRHDDRHGGWKEHGCHCRGCRHCIFLALGPEIKADTVITGLRDQIDIAPTVGHLLGFPTPLAQGSVLTEMFRAESQRCRVTVSPAARHTDDSGEVNLSRSIAHSRSADITRNASGLHVVYSDCSRGSFETYYTRSTDAGATWSTPAVILPAASLSSSNETVIAASEDTLIVAAAGLRYLPAETTFTWVLSVRRSTNSGLSWEAVREIDTLTTLSCKPAITTLGSRVYIVANLDNHLKSYLSLNAGATFDTGTVAAIKGKYHPQWPSATVLDTMCFAVWQGCNGDLIHPYHDIWFDREPWRVEDVQLTRNDTTNYSYQPFITRDVVGLLHVVYCQLPNALRANDWQVHYTRSLTRGATWSSATRLSTIRVGYAPVIRASAAGRLTCIWTGYGEPYRRISGCASTNHGQTWTSPEPVSRQSPFAAEPRLAVRGDTAFVVWEDYRDGNWEIYFTSKVLTGTGVEEENSTPYAPRTTLYANPNPFRGATVLRTAYGVQGGAPLAIFNAFGRLVRSFPASSVEHPAYGVTWNGRDDSGRPLPAGVYSCVLTASGATATQRLVLLK